MDQTLDRETKVFDEHLDAWRTSHMGEFVLIKGDDVIGFSASLAEAFSVGTARFGLEPFLVKQIVPVDVVNVSLYGRRLHVA